MKQFYFQYIYGMLLHKYCSHYQWAWLGKNSEQEYIYSQCNKVNLQDDVLEIATTFFLAAKKTQKLPSKKFGFYHLCSATVSSFRNEPNTNCQCKQSPIQP